MASEVEGAGIHASSRGPGPDPESDPDPGTEGNSEAGLCGMTPRRFKSDRKLHDGYEEVRTSGRYDRGDDDDEDSSSVGWT